jgi:3-hydroxyisobutyrate dehydrogenase
MAEIGFIGLGNMGGPMARNLVKAGHQVKGYDLVEANLKAAADGGVSRVDAPGEAVSGVQVVVSMLPAGEHVREVYAGNGRVIEKVSKGTLLIDCSTIDVASARAVAEAASAAGLQMLDAPVSGGVAGAENAALTFMVGGETEAFECGKPVLEAMGKAVIHAGPSGNGQVAKACNNMMLGISMIALAEGFTLAEKQGLDAQTLFNISSKASGMSWAMLNHLPVEGIVETSAANRNWQPGFAAGMMLKDLRLAKDAALAAGVSTPLGSVAEALYAMFCNGGNATLDYSAIIKMIQGAKVD